MTKQRVWRRGIAVLGAGVLGASALLAGGAAAAAPGGVRHAAASGTYSYGDIDGAVVGSLMIHKYADQTDGGEGRPDGSVDPGFTDPIGGVTFTAYPLLAGGTPLDLTTAAAWSGLEAAASAVADDPACTAPLGYTLGATGIDIGPTDADGIAAEELAVGAYVVCETVAPSTVTKRTNPFLVTIPFPVIDASGVDPVDKGWLYDVIVYPKNSVGTFEKHIASQVDLGVGAGVDFTITGRIPDIAPGLWTEFTVSDTLDARLDALSPYAVVTTTPSGGPVTVEYDAVTRTVIVRFTDAAWLTANAGSAFEIAVPTRVNSAGASGIDNRAQQWVNNPALDLSGNPPTATDAVTTSWGSAQLLKTDDTDTAAGLQGAEFSVYEGVPAYAATSTACSTSTVGAPIVFNVGSADATATIVSGAGGSVDVPALFVSDSEHNPKHAAFRCYVLVETKAPAGYVTPQGAAAHTALPITIGANDLRATPITNAQQAIPGLPMTGAQGQVLLVTAGLGAAAIVLGLVLVNRRRQNGGRREGAE
ncbi:MAG: SpaH/EbpB family LPXTG-anchored major pilin [Microbacteriaceae bacterium]|jgi:fimbrial isopeptide formation D2 family protein/LPXTG-motif cell wall-anchored protein|nr:SpaH/EbpB family LPXTG-anchored major pilin [Microbacteriaceae bacterium]HPZ34538.1 SpaH/EbpB family LPXTG-anchored major pilin [Microbacteriaceae bacterium]HQC92301.1 SpaH/EbpB family LPXTG-anchored major pilin [Microbacteriaceae bacterium]